MDSDYFSGLFYNNGSEMVEEDAFDYYGAGFHNTDQETVEKLTFHNQTDDLAKLAIHQIDVLNQILEKRFLSCMVASQPPADMASYKQYIENISLFPEKMSAATLPPSLRLDIDSRLNLYKTIVDLYEQRKIMAIHGYPLADDQCSFCKNNNEPEFIYRSHRLKAQQRVTCPILRIYECPMCNSSGDNAHTLKYCPIYNNKATIQN